MFAASVVVVKLFAAFAAKCRRRAVECTEVVASASMHEL